MTANIDKLSILKNNVSTLKDSDASFAHNLMGSLAKWGKLSEKQWHWVGVLADRSVAPKVEKTTVDVGELSGLMTLFDTASKHLKHPKIRIQTAYGQPIMLAIAGKQSKCPGQINITDGEKYGENKWFGRVTRAGQFEPSNSSDPGISEYIPSVTDLLKEISDNAEQAAATYGQLTGNCSFCNAALGEGEDQRSVEVGYGETCARNFGLPFPKKAKAA
jgi:hypothetical protein